MEIREYSTKYDNAGIIIRIKFTQQYNKNKNNLKKVQIAVQDIHVSQKLLEEYPSKDIESKHIVCNKL